MKKRLSRWGVGPRISSSAIAYAAVAGAATYYWPDACILSFLPVAAATWAGGVLIAIGLPMWLVAAYSVMRAYNRDQLVSTGVFGIVRHPLYAAWIVLLLPGLALWTRSWPLLLTPLVGYLVFRALIHREDEYLAERFGKSYLEYRARVNAVCPVPPFWRR